MVNIANRETRHFGGELFIRPDEDGKRSPQNKALRNFEKKHLRAYLRGDKGFSFGRDKEGKPRWFLVIEKWY